LKTTFSVISKANLTLELKKCIVLLEKASAERDFKQCSTLTKEFKKLRKLFTLADTLLVVKHYMPDLFRRLALPAQPTDLQTGETIEQKLHCSVERTIQIMSIPEPQLFIYVLLQMKLIDDGDYKNVSLFKVNSVG